MSVFQQGLLYFPPCVVELDVLKHPSVQQVTRLGSREDPPGSVLSRPSSGWWDPRGCFFLEQLHV